MEILFWWFDSQEIDHKLLLSWKLKRHDQVLDRDVYANINLTTSLTVTDPEKTYRLSLKMHRFDKVLLSSRFANTP